MTNQEGPEWEDIELTPSLNYTEAGIKRLALVIRATAKKLKISQNELGRRAGLSTGTMSRYCSANTKLKRPQEEVLRALAPFVYRVQQINRSSVRFDLTQTYGEDWLSLAAIATDDFTPSPDQLSSPPTPPNNSEPQQPPTRIMRLLEHAVNNHGSYEACAEYSGLTVAEINSLLHDRRKPTSVDVGFLSALLKIPDPVLCDLIREDYSQQPHLSLLTRDYLYDLQEQMRTNVFRSST